MRNCPISFNAEFPVYSPDNYCNRTEPNARLLDFHHFFNRVYGRINQNYDKWISKSTLDRARIFFYQTFYDNSRFSSYGAVLKHVFSFRPVTHSYVHDILAKTMSAPSNSIRISVHLRHNIPSRIPAEELEEPFDNAAMDAIRIYKNKFNNMSHCYVFIASDRTISMDRVHEFSRSIGCVPYSAPRNESNKSEDDDRSGYSIFY